MSNFGKFFIIAYGDQKGIFTPICNQDGDLFIFNTTEEAHGHASKSPYLTKFKYVTLRLIQKLTWLKHIDATIPYIIH